MNDIPPRTRLGHQRFFLRWVVQPEPIARLAAARHLRLTDVVRAADEAEATGRLSIYQRMIFARLLASLAEDFPAVAAVLGEAGFAELVAEFLVACPSAGPNLRDLGSPLPGFLGRFPRGRADLAELAQLEWSRLVAFDAIDDVPFGVAELHAAIDHGQRLRLVAGTSVLHVDHAVDATWTAIDCGEPEPPVAWSPGELLVWKCGLRVWHRRVESWERSLLLRLCDRGETIAVPELCAALAPAQGAEPAAVVWQRLQRWIGDGLMTSA